MFDIVSVMKNNIRSGQIELVERRILLIRGRKVIVDVDLAEFYGVPVKRLREQVRRNKNKFPDDFLFILTHKEKKKVVDACRHLDSIRYSRTPPYVFTEFGSIMAATILNSSQAVEMSILVVRAFVKLREALLNYENMASKIRDIEAKMDQHDAQILSLVKAIRQLLSTEPVPESRQIGFKPEDKSR